MTAPAGVFVQPDSDGTPTVWLHNTAEPTRPIALLVPGNLGRRGQELLWPYIVREMPHYSGDACAEPTCDGELHYTGRRHPETNEDIEAGPCPLAAVTG